MEECNRYRTSPFVAALGIITVLAMLCGAAWLLVGCAADVTHHRAGPPVTGPAPVTPN